MRNTIFFLTPVLAAVLLMPFCGALPNALGYQTNSIDPHQRPIIKVKEGTSSNWSGYVAESSLSGPKSGFITAVVGTWKVPSVTCGVSYTYSSIWVGIDGFSDGTVEQLGTEQDCHNGLPAYYAWYEMYPNPGYYIPISVKAGHTITASVKYNFTTGKFALWMRDITTGKTFFKAISASGQARTSAEWVVEAPYSGGILPLSNFGTATFSKAQYSDTSPGGTTLHAIDFHGPGSYDSITMNDPNGGTSSPGPLTDMLSHSRFSASYS